MAPRTPLLRPGAYFDRYDRPTLERALATVFVAGVLATGITWYVASSMLESLATSLPEHEVAEIAVLPILLNVFLSIIIGWIVGSALLHVLVWFMDPDRGIGTTAAIVGESLVVSIALFPVYLAGVVQFVHDLPSDPAALQQLLGSSMLLESRLLVLISAVITIWGALIQASGLIQVQGISRGRAYVTMFVLVCFSTALWVIVAQ